MAGVIKSDAFGDAFLVFVPDGSSDFVNLRGNAGKDLQAGLRLGRRSPVAGVLHREERLTAPGTGYLGEKPVLYWVVFRAIRRVVHHYYVDAEPFGKIHEVLLHNMMAAGVGATAVTEDYEKLGALVHFGEVFVPESLHVVADELGGVVAESDGHETDVVRHVIDAVRNNHAVGERGEIMVEAFGTAETIHLPIPLEVADDFLLLGVYTDYRDAEPDAEFLDILYLDKLLIPTLHTFQRDVLAERPLLEPAPLEEFSDMIRGDSYTFFRHPFPYPFRVDVKPNGPLVHRVSSHVVGDNLKECGSPLWVHFNLVLRTAARHALLAIRRRNVVEKIMNCPGNGIWGTLKNLAYSPSGAAIGAHRLACNKMPSVSFFKRINEFHFHFVNPYWRFLLHQCKSLEINYKDTKISPVICCLKC